MMRKFLITAVISIGLAGRAFAADLPPQEFKALPPPPATWTGCYANAGGGYGFWNIDHNIEPIPGIAAATASATDGGRGWFGRFGGGCDYQFRALGYNVVIGAFGDYDAMNLNGTVQTQLISPAGFPLQSSEKEQNAWSVGGRLGVLLTPTVLGFFDGGFTQTKFGPLTEFDTFGVPSGFGFGSGTYRGWFLGSGFETSLAAVIPGLALPGLYLRTEYRYSSYGSTDLTQINLATGAPTVVAIRMTPTVQTVTTTLVYKFNFFNWALAR